MKNRIIGYGFLIIGTVTIFADINALTPMGVYLMIWAHEMTGKHP